MAWRGEPPPGCSDGQGEERHLRYGSKEAGNEEAYVRRSDSTFHFEDPLRRQRRCDLTSGRRGTTRLGPVSTWIDRRPAFIVRFADDTDVVRVIALARETGFELAFRSGGHSIPGHALSEGGMVLDLSGLAGLDRRGVPRASPELDSDDEGGLTAVLGGAMARVPVEVTAFAHTGGAN